MPTNRIADDPEKSIRAPLVKAYQALAWRCPDCGHVQFAERSTTAVQKCKRCEKPFTVYVRA